MANTQRSLFIRKAVQQRSKRHNQMSRSSTSESYTGIWMSLILPYLSDLVSSCPLVTCTTSGLLASCARRISSSLSLIFSWVCISKRLRSLSSFSRRRYVFHLLPFQPQIWLHVPIFRLLICHRVPIFRLLICHRVPTSQPPNVFLQERDVAHLLLFVVAASATLQPQHVVVQLSLLPDVL